MPKKLACLIVILLATGVPTQSEETALQREAARFHREALVMHKSRSYELALQHAETAFALAPESQECKETLVRCLSDLAQSLLVREIAPDPYHREAIIATPEGAAKSLVLINRAFDLIEKDPKYFNAYQLGPDVSNHGHRCLVGRYFEAARLIPADIYPEWKAESDTFMSRVITDWTEFRYPYRSRLVEDEKTFHVWQRRAQPPWYIHRCAPASIAATIYETHFRDLFAFRKKYPESPLDSTYRWDLYGWGGFSSFAKRYLSHTLMEQTWQQGNPEGNYILPDTPENRLARQIVERILKTFSEQDSVFFDVFAWCLLQEAKLNNRLTEIPFPVVRVENNRYVDIGEKARDFQVYNKALLEVMATNEKEILEKIDSIPKEALLDDYDEIYSLLISSFDSFRDMVAHIAFTYQEKLPIPPSTVDRICVAFLAALARGDILYNPISEVATRDSSVMSSLRNENGWSRDLTPEEIQKTVNACRRAVEALDAGTATTGRGKNAKGENIDTNIRNTLQRYYEAHTALLEPPPTHAPWKEEIVLSEDVWIRYDVGPFSIAKETFGVLLDKPDWDNQERHGWRSGTLVPILINLETLEKTELDSWYYLDKDHGNMAISSSETGDWQFFCGAKYAAVGSSYAGFSIGKKEFGIIVFPRDGTRAFVIDMDTGLPSNRVRGLGVLGDTLYAGVGDWDSTTWLVKIDLPTRKVEILSSSRGKEGKAPFFDLEKAPQFRHFVYDAKRERLLFQVLIGNMHPLEGLWTLDGKNREIVQMSNRREFLWDSNPGEILADGDTYLTGSSGTQFLNGLGDAGKHFLTDLRDGTVTPLTTSFSQCTVQQGWIWGLMPSAIKGKYDFVRVRSDQSTGNQRTEEEKLFHSGTEHSTFLATPDGKGLIRYDNRNRKIVLFRL